MAKRVDIKHVREHASFEAVLAHYGVALTGSTEQRKIRVDVAAVPDRPELAGFAPAG